MIKIEADAEILEQVPTLAAKCQTLLFTSSDRCLSMEHWQRIFEANGFRFVENTYDPSPRSQLYESLL